jgi:hypothetical protein
LPGLSRLFLFSETLQSALIDGMSALIVIQARMQSDSGNINYEGINIDNSQAAYVDLITKKGNLETAAQAMAGDMSRALAAAAAFAAQFGALKDKAHAPNGLLPV